MQRKYFNLAGDYTPILERCVRERLWIQTSQRWHGPFDWAYQFGVTFFGFNWSPRLADPYTLIAKARQDLSGDDALARDRDAYEKVSQALEKFELRVNAYYNSGKDELLLKSIETGHWH